MAARFPSVIFDLDGTLLDSMGMWYNLDRRFLAENGIEAPADISDIVKAMTIERAAEYFVERFRLKMTPAQVIARIEQLADDAYRYDLPLKPGAKALLSGLAERGIPCALASVTYPGLLEAALERLGIRQYFRAVLTPTGAHQGKHTPALYFDTVQALGTTPAQTIVLEDALYAAETAKSAGFYTIGVRDEIGRPDWPQLVQVCDRVVDSLTELDNMDFYSLFLQKGIVDG